MFGLTEFKFDCPNVLFKFSWNLYGRSIAQMMIRWFLRAEARVQFVKGKVPLHWMFLRVLPLCVVFHQRYKPTFSSPTTVCAL